MDALTAGRFGGYVAAAYGVSAGGLVALTVWTLARGLYWKRRAGRAASRRRAR